MRLVAATYSGNTGTDGQLPQVSLRNQKPQEMFPLSPARTAFIFAYFHCPSRTGAAFAVPLAAFELGLGPPRKTRSSETIGPISVSLRGWPRRHSCVACRLRPRLGTRHALVSCKRRVTLLRFCPIYSPLATHLFADRLGRTQTQDPPSKLADGAPSA